MFRCLFQVSRCSATCECNTTRSAGICVESRVCVSLSVTDCVCVCVFVSVSIRGVDMLCLIDRYREEVGNG